MATPAAALIDALDTALASLTENTNLFEGPVRATSFNTPASSVFVQTTSGPAPEPLLNNTHDIYRSTVQVVVRSALEDGYATGMDWARNVHQACQRATLSGRVYSLLRESEPTFAGHDANENGGHFLWTFNVEVCWRS